MIQFLKNTWVVGIIGGIISGLIVFFITEYLVIRRNNKIYENKIKQANIDMINLLKPYIADFGLPEIDIFRSLISATARKYEIDTRYMYTIVTYCEELVLEIIGNVYLSKEKKNEYTIHILDYIEPLKKDEKQREEEIILEGAMKYNRFSPWYIGYRRKSIISYTSAILTFLISILVIFVNNNQDILLRLKYFFQNNTILVSVLIPIIISIFFLVIARFLRSRFYH